MTLKLGDKVKVITKNSLHEGRIGTVVGIFEDEKTCRVQIEQDVSGGTGFLTAGVVTGFFVTELEVLDEKREALIQLAETLDKVRTQANAIDAHEVYEHTSDALVKTLALITDDYEAILVYASIIQDGNSVRQALKWVESQK